MQCSTAAAFAALLPMLQAQVSIYLKCLTELLKSVPARATPTEKCHAMLNCCRHCCASARPIQPQILRPRQPFGRDSRSAASAVQAAAHSHQWCMAQRSRPASAQAAALQHFPHKRNVQCKEPSLVGHSGQARTRSFGLQVPAAF